MPDDQIPIGTPRRIPRKTAADWLALEERVLGSFVRDEKKRLWMVRRMDAISAAAWLHGCMAAWLHGCMAAWLHGEKLAALRLADVLGYLEKLTRNREHSGSGVERGRIRVHGDFGPSTGQSGYHAGAQRREGFFKGK